MIANAERIALTPDGRQFDLNHLQGEDRKRFDWTLSRFTAWSEEERRKAFASVAGKTPLIDHLKGDAFDHIFGTVQAIGTMRHVLAALPEFQQDFDRSIELAVEVCKPVAKASKSRFMDDLVGSHANAKQYNCIRALIDAHALPTPVSYREDYYPIQEENSEPNPGT